MNKGGCQNKTTRLLTGSCEECLKSNRNKDCWCPVCKYFTESLNCMLIHCIGEKKAIEGIEDLMEETKKLPTKITTPITVWVDRGDNPIPKVEFL